MSTSNNKNNNEKLSKKISYRLLGNSGLRVFPLCLGTMSFGKSDLFSSMGCGSLEEDAEKMFLKYIEVGGNFIDTANFYQNGQSEEWIAKFISKNNINRDELVIATKYSLPMSKNVNFTGNQKKNMILSVNASLKRLNTDYIDILYVHFWDFSVPIDQLMKSLDELVKSGKVLHVAISDTPAWEVARANTLAKVYGWSPFVCYQGRYSLSDRSLEQEVIPMSKATDTGIVPWGVLGQGKLTGKRTRENTEGDDTHRKGVTMSELDFKIQDKVIEISKELKVSPVQVAINWCLHKSGVSSVLLGPRTYEQFLDNIAALEFKLTDKQMSELDEISKDSPPKIFPHAFIGNSPQTSSWIHTLNKDYKIDPTN